MLGRAVLKTRTPEADQVTRDRTVAPVPVGLPVTIVLDQLLPGSQQPRCVSATIRECGPGTPHSGSGESEVGQARDDGATALEQATAEEHP